MRLDPHSFADTEHPQATFFTWKARVDFASRTLHCEATLRFSAAGQGPLDLDTRDLSIDAIRDGGGEPLAYSLAPADPILGSRLRVELPAKTEQITIAYRTSPNATALQWLGAEQTAGGKQPF